jgi:hypothetical protein
VKEFKGSLSAEHGVGIARTEYMREQLGDELLGAMREIKRIFDPRDRMNPGKIFGTGNFRIDSSLRENFTRANRTAIQRPGSPLLSKISHSSAISSSATAAAVVGRTRPRCVLPSSQPAKKSCPPAAGLTLFGKFCNGARTGTIRWNLRNWMRR